MKKYRYLWILLIFLAVIFPKDTYAYNSMTFKNLTIDSGLSQATVETVIQDSKGYIWIGTNDGLNRYNGSEIKVFKSDKDSNNSIINNYIIALAEDHQGNLWIGTDEGISKINLETYDIKNYRYYENNKNTPYYTVSALYVDDDGILYMGNTNGVYTYNKEKDEFQQLIGQKNELSNSSVYSLTKDKNGNLWIGTEEGINKLDKNTNKVTVYNKGNLNTLEWGEIYSILFDNENNMWVATVLDGLKKINLSTNKVKTYTVDEDDKYSLKSSCIMDLLQDRQGNIWIATENGLSKYLGDDKFTTYLNKPYDSTSLVNNVVYKLIEDDSGLIWAGTYTGVSMFDPNKKIETYRYDPLEEDVLSSNVIHGIYEDNEGLIWVGTRDRGLNIIDRKNDKVNHIYEGNSNYDLNTNSINVITGKDNIIWVGTRSGVNKINKDTMVIDKYTTQDGLIDNNIKSLCIDSHNRLWIGTTKGLSLLDIESGKITDITVIIENHGIEKPYIEVIYEDSDGIIWMGGFISGGLIRLDPRTNEVTSYTSYKDEDSDEEIVINTPRSIVEDEKGNLWIGTSSGLLYFYKNTESFKVYTEKDGLANDIVYEILVDEDKNLWMSTNNGISKFNIQEEQFTNLTTTDGLQSIEFNAKSAYKCSSNEFLFGGINGLNIFNPDEVFTKTKSYQVKFDSFEVNGVEVDNIDNKSFEYNENTMRIRYFIPDYRINEDTLYYYQLSGVSDNWYSMKGNEIFISDLNPGKYTLSIKYRNSDGLIVGENSINFKINPPVWKTPMAIALYILAIIIIIYNHLNKVDKLDKLVERRTKQLYDEMSKNKILFDKVIDSERSKNNYFINLSHELRTPLNVINSIEQLIRSFCSSDKELSKDKLASYMDMMKANTDRLLNLINNIIDTSKIENGKYKLNLDYYDIVYIVEEATLSLKEAVESSGIELIVDTDVEEKIILCDKYDIERCIVNLVSNAQKFTPSGGSISVKINDLDEQIQITVEDSGIGIEKKYHNSIFDRFNQVVDEHSEVKGGSGLGLTITKHIIDLHKGKIFIESEKNKGTKFTIILPGD